MVCLYSAEQGVLIGADQILPRISPYIGVVSWEPDGDPWPPSWPATRPSANCRATRWCCPPTASPSSGCSSASMRWTPTMPSGWTR
ncbi:hypothetical protein ACFQU7_12725 [Pseudoroseomonas wenyumeiae]